MPQLKVTTVIAGEANISTIAVPKPAATMPGQSAAQQEATTINSAIIHAVSGAINMAMQQKIERLSVEVVG